MAESNGVYIPVNLDVDEAERELAKLKKQISSAEMEKVKISVEMDANDELLKELEARRAELEAAMQNIQLTTVNGKLEATSDVYSPEEIAQIQTAYGAVRQRIAEVTEQSETLKQKWESVNEEIHSTEQAAEALKTIVGEGEKPTSRLEVAFEKAQEASAKFEKRMIGLVKRMLFFNVFSQGLRAVRTWFGKTLKTSKEFTASLNALKGSFMTLITPIINWAIPRLTTLIQVLNAIVQQVGRFIFGLFGKSWGEAADKAKDMSKSMAATAGSAAKTKKSLAGIDEINQLDGNSGGGGGGSAPTFETAEITDKIMEIEAIVGGALLALGAILALSGINVPLGIALMAAGALTLVAMANADWSAMSTETQNALAQIVTVVSAALLALGAILALSGVNIPLGLALIAVGALTLVSMAKANWGAVGVTVRQTLAKITELVSMMVLALGAILVLSGVNIPLGLGLLIAGAAGLAASVALSWGLVENETKQRLGKISSVVSGFLLALGVICLIAGQVGWGIGLIIAGIAAGVTAAAVNWDTVPNRTTATLKTLAGIAAGAMLVIGILLVLTGVGIGLGLALIIGAVGVAAISFDWNFIPNKVRKIWDDVKQWWNTHVKPIFTIDYWKQKFSTIAEGLRLKIKDGVNSAIGLFNRFIDWINKKLHIEWGAFKLFGATIIPSGSFQLLTIPHIPALAEGTVVPPNREFLAMLGDNKQETEVVSPLSTMKEALMEALAESGIGNNKVAVYVDGRELFDIIVGRNNAEVMRTGKTRLAT